MYLGLDLAHIKIYSVFTYSVLQCKNFHTSIFCFLSVLNGRKLMLRLCLRAWYAMNSNCCIAGIYKDLQTGERRL
jgi:hypothetical protein